MKAQKLIIISVASVVILIAGISIHEINVNHDIARFIKGRIINHLKKQTEPQTLFGAQIKIISVEKNAYGCKFYKINGEADFADNAGKRLKRPFRCIVIESGPPPHRFLDFTYTDNGEKILE